MAWLADGYAHRPNKRLKAQGSKWFRKPRFFPSVAFPLKVASPLTVQGQERQLLVLPGAQSPFLKMRLQKQFHLHLEGAPVSALLNAF